MIEAFKNNVDIHTNTAMRVFGIPNPDDVTSEMRRQAKAVNFGIVYGISDYGLSQNLNISRKTLIVIVQRGEKILIPSGSLVLRAEDKVILYTKRDVRDSVEIEV